MNYEQDAMTLMEALLRASRDAGELDCLAELSLGDRYDLDPDTMDESDYQHLLRLTAAWRQIRRPDMRTARVWKVVHDLFLERAEGYREAEAEQARDAGRPKALRERRPMAQARILMRELLEASEEHRWDGEGQKEQAELETHVGNFVDACGYVAKPAGRTGGDRLCQIPLTESWKKLPTPDDHVAWIWAVVLRLLQEVYSSDLPIPVIE